jgi:hypothetical protein
MGRAASRGFRTKSSSKSKLKNPGFELLRGLFVVISNPTTIAIKWSSSVCGSLSHVHSRGTCEELLKLLDGI